MQKNYLAIDLRGYPSELFEHVCQVLPWRDFQRTGRGLFGVEVEALFQLESLPKADLVFAKGGAVQKNRKFLNSRRANVLSRPYPFDSVQARMAAEHNIALELSFKEVESTTGYVRARVLTHLQKTVTLARKYHAPMVITSGASAAEQVKSPRTLVALGKILGLDYGEAKACIYTLPKRVLEGAK